MIPTDRWSQVKHLFQESQQRPDNDRQHWLAQQCGSDDALMRDVLDLLNAQRAEPGILADGAVAVLSKLRSDDPPTDQLGQRVGAYRILRLLGEGGMGRVYLAEREEGDFVQRVALKLIRADFMSDAARVRFLRERKILAGFVHPHIAQLHDGGVASDGAPYFTLEYVEGQKITDYCDSRSLTIRQRVELILQVCSAVTYAHRNLIVHRDLKPSNILVTADGDVKLLDFGIAKLVGAEVGEGGTATDARMMTPEYAAPEQVLGDKITTATDVYAIGVLLYELLCGRLPYARADAGSISWAKAVVEETPENFGQALSRAAGTGKRLTGDAAAVKRGTTLPVLRRTLRGDLDHIVQRTLAKEPEQRYASVTALADDLSAYVGGRAISGGNRRYRLRVFVRRRWIPLTAAAMFLALLIAGAVAIVWQSQQTAREASKTTAVKDFLLELFRNANPNVAQGKPVSVRELVDRGAQRIDLIPAEHADLKAELQNALGTVYYQLGFYTEAKQLHEKAFAAVKDQSDQALLAAYAERQEATDTAALGDNASAQTLADDAIVRLRAIRHAPSRDVARALSTAGWLAKKRADIPRVKELSEQAFALAKLTPDDDEIMYLALRQIGEFDRLTNDENSAVENYRQAYDIAKRLFGPEDQETVVVERLVGTSYNYLSQFEQAQRYLQPAFDTSRRIFGESSGRALRDGEMLAVNEIDWGHFDEAGPLLDALLSRAESATPLDEGVLGEIRLNYGEFQSTMSHPDKAERSLLAVRDFLRQGGGDAGELAEVMNGLGNAHRQEGKLDLAENDLHEALTMLAAAHIDDTSGVLAHLSEVQLAKGDVAAALESGKAAHDAAIAVSGEKSLSAAAAHTAFAMALIASKDANRARDELRAALASYAAMVPPDGLHPSSADTRLTLGSMLAEAPATREEGIHFIEQAVALDAKYFGDAAPTTHHAREMLLAAHSPLKM